MVDVNLHKAAEKELRIKRKQSVLKSGTFISITLLIVVGALFGLTILYQISLESRRDGLIQAKEIELNSIDTDSINEVVDFKERFKSIISNLDSKSSPKVTLETMEGLLVQDVALSKLVYDGDKGILEIEAISSSFESAASQMLSLKKNKMFSDVKIIDSGRDESGKVVFSLEAYFVK